jgi:tetratricopeptide (TPR) repeat protein
MWRVALWLTLAGSALLGETHKSDALAQAQIGVAQAQKERYPEAIEAYKRAIAIDPDLPGIYLNLGLAWFKLGKFHEAIAALNQENPTAPGDQVTTLLAMSYYGLGQFKEAAGRLKPIAARQPDNTELSYLLANCYLWSGQYREAMDVFNELLKRDPNSAAMHMLLGEAMDAYYRTDDAILEFQAAARQAPTQPDVHFGLGYLYWKQKRYPDAEREFRAELKNNPKHAQAMAYLGDAVMQAGRKTETLELLKRAVELQRNLRVAHFDLGIVYAENQDYEPAIAELREAIRIDPTGFAAHYRLARLYQELGRTAEADAEFAEVHKLHQKKDEEPLIKLRGPQ